MDIYLTSSGEPVTNAEISFIYDMVYMSHGPFQADSTNLDNGHYVVTFDFIMLGLWGFDAIIQIPDMEEQWHLWIDLSVWPVD